jgi:hypothetical protein
MRSRHSSTPPPAKRATSRNDPEWWQREWNRNELQFSVGKSDFAVNGPLFETFRNPRRSRPDRSLGQRILDLPIVNLFVPQPMPKPPSEGEKYLAWGDRDLPWSAIADRGMGGPCGLLSVNW